MSKCHIDSNRWSNVHCPGQQVRFIACVNCNYCLKAGRYTVYERFRIQLDAGRLMLLPCRRVGWWGEWYGRAPVYAWCFPDGHFRALTHPRRILLFNSTGRRTDDNRVVNGEGSACRHSEYRHDQRPCRRRESVTAASRRLCGKCKRWKRQRRRRWLRRDETHKSKRSRDESTGPPGGWSRGGGVQTPRHLSFFRILCACRPTEILSGIYTESRRSNAISAYTFLIKF